MNNLITVIITVISPPHDRGVNAKKTDFKQYFGRNERQLIQTANSNMRCLFYALDIARIYHDKKPLIYSRRKDILS